MSFKNTGICGKQEKCLPVFVAIYSQFNYLVLQLLEFMCFVLLTV